MGAKLCDICGGWLHKCRTFGHIEGQEGQMVWYKPDGTRVRGLPQTHLVREDGRVERLCKHGVGHPEGHVKKGGWQEWMWVHGCDDADCCHTWKLKGVARIVPSW